MLRTLLFTLAAAAAAPSAAYACNCAPTDIVHSYQNHDHVLLARAVSSRAIGGAEVWTFDIRKDLKECASPGTRVQIATPDNPAACGTRFTPGETYVLFAYDQVIGGRTRMVTTACSANTPLSQVSQADRDYLMHRPLFCGGAASCVDGSQPLNCFADPCTVAQPCGGGMCEANYCGGCTAEWYDPMGYGVCMPW